MAWHKGWNDYPSYNSWKEVYAYFMARHSKKKTYRSFESRLGTVVLGAGTLTKPESLRIVTAWTKNERSVTANPTLITHFPDGSQIVNCTKLYASDEDAIRLYSRAQIVYSDVAAINGRRTNRRRDCSLVIHGQPWVPAVDEIRIKADGTIDKRTVKPYEYDVIVDKVKAREAQQKAKALLDQLKVRAKLEVIKGGNYWYPGVVVVGWLEANMKKPLDQADFLNNKLTKGAIERFNLSRHSFIIARGAGATKKVRFDRPVQSPTDALIALR